MLKKILLQSLCLCLILSPSLANSLPYNYRVINDHIHAGGHPLGPAIGFGNSDKQVTQILDMLKEKGVMTIIDLENTGRIQARYQKLLDLAGIKRLHVPMHNCKVPSLKEWREIKAALKNPVYVHCKWGADRTGAILGRYLVEVKGYPPLEAYKAVITGGSCAGKMGGLKTTPLYQNLKNFIFQH